METKKLVDIIAEIRKSAVASSLIPMELVSGLPSVSLIRGQICLTIPYYKVTVSPEDRTLIYPFTHTVTALWPSGKIVSYRNLNFVSGLKKLDLSKPVGLFRHEAIKHLSKHDFFEMKSRLLTCYDEYLQCISEAAPYEKLPEMKIILNTVMEPSLKPMYLMIGKNFFQPLIKL